MKLSIVITTRNRYDDLRACISSIESSVFGASYEVIVVDDASHDATASVLAEQLSSKINLKLIRNEEQVMMVRARNQGAKIAQGNYILFIDDDNEIEPDMMFYLCGHLDRFPKVGIVGPAMYRYGSLEPYFTSQRINLWTGHTKGYIDTLTPIQASDGVPNVFMIRRTVLENCDYFDERIVQTFTEPDFSYSASKKMNASCEILVVAKTFHKSDLKSIGTQISANQFRQKAYYLMRNRTIIVLRYGTILQKTIYILLFSWVWPLAYSLIAVRHLRFDLAILFWYGFHDSLKLLFGNELPSNPDSVARVLRLMHRYRPMNRV